MTRRATSADEPLHILTVCGVGMGSSLILRMTAEEALRDIGVDARVEATDISSARGMRPDVVIGQGMHTGEIADLAPIVVTVANFLDRAGLARELRERLAAAGWIEPGEPAEERAKPAPKDPGSDVRGNGTA